MSFLKNFVFGSAPNTRTRSLLDPSQQALLGRVAGLGTTENLQSVFGQTQQQVNAGGNAFVGDVNLGGAAARQLLAGFNQIENIRQRQTAEALRSGERFSSANRLLRGRLAGEAALRRSSLLAGTLNQVRLQQIQSRENQFRRGLQAQQLQTQRTGQAINLLTAPLNVKARENVVQQGSAGLLSGLVTGLASGVGSAVGKGIAG